MLNPQNILLKSLPYVLSTMAGIIFFLNGIILDNGNIRTLFIAISATFFTIPLIYLFYQLAYNFSQKKLNKAIFDYAKMQIDREILSILDHLMKTVIPYLLEKKDFSHHNINKFLSLKKKHIFLILSRSEYLGFQIFKKWNLIEDSLHDILKNSFIIQKMEGVKIIPFIQIIQSIRELEKIQNSNKAYVKVKDRNLPFKVILTGNQILGEVNKYKNYFNKHLLLKNIGKNKNVVYDFGNFAWYHEEKLLNLFRVDKKYTKRLTFATFDLITQINKWVDFTGKEFLIDTKMFKLNNKNNYSQHNKNY